MRDTSKATLLVHPCYNFNNYSVKSVAALFATVQLQRRKTFRVLQSLPCSSGMKNVADVAGVTNTKVFGAHCVCDRSNQESTEPDKTQSDSSECW